MPRLILVVFFGLLAATPVQAQRADVPAKKSGALPAEALPSRQQVVPRTIGVPQATPPQNSRLSEEEVLRKIGRIYRLQSEVLEAQANGDSEAAEDLLGLALNDLATLVQQPGMMERPRFRETYRTLVIEYERYYGIEPDSLGLQYGDIFAARADMFAELNALDNPLLEDVFLKDVRPIDTQIAMTMNRLVEQSVAYLLRSPDKHLYNWMSRAETYFPMIEKILAEEDVPDELKYLAMIESGLNPRAKSWASAVGMWQFMAPTGRMYGLQVNSWVDDRMNPEKATRAAAQHMRDLYATFGDWHLALAAYNCGTGNVKKAQRRSGRTSFWDIYDYLPRETRNYVPMFIAASLVASNPDAFDLRTVDPGPRYAYHQVPVEGMLSIKDVARLAGTTEATIRALNPELKQSTLPPSRSAYYVRVPFGTHEQFIAAYEKMPAAARTTAVEHVVRRGDSLGRIGSKHGISTSALMTANNLRSTVIHPGQRLMIPVPTYSSGEPVAPIEPGKVLAVDYGSRMNRPIVLADATPQRTQTARRSTPVVNASTPAAERAVEKREDRPSTTAANTAPAEREVAEDAPDTRVVYSVRRGDNLTTIAKKYGVRVADIRGWNNLRGNTIRPGQRLTLFTNSEGPAQPASVTHLVRRGETLGGLARKYGVRVADIRGWNNLRNNNIRIGQRLTINPKNAGPITHRVSRGDTLTDIAARYGVSISQLKEWNRLRSNTIRVGQQLTIRT